MTIHKQLIMPNGAITQFHKIAKIEIDDSITTTVSSFIDNVTNTVSWQEPIDTPASIFTSGNPLQDVYAYLILPNQYLATGTLVNMAVNTLEQARLRKYQETNDALLVVESAGCVLPSIGFVSTDINTRIRFLGLGLAALTAKAANTAFQMSWTKSTDFTPINITTPDQMLAIEGQLSVIQGAILQKGHILTQMIRVATTVEQLNAISWDMNPALIVLPT